MIPITMTKELKVSSDIEKQLGALSEKMAQLSAELQNKFEQDTIRSLGLGLNWEEPDVISAKEIQLKVKQVEADFEKAQQAKAKEIERKLSEQAYEGNDDYGQF